VDPADVTFLYAGLHGVAQGLGQLLDAWAALPETSRARLVLVGDGPEREDLMARARTLGLSRVRFHPSIPREEVPGVLASSQVLVVPLKGSIPGAVPSKLYEAMAMGRPVLLVAEGEPAGIVEATGAGVVVAPGDVPAIAAAVHRLEESEALRSEMGTRGREVAVSRYDRRAIVAGFADLLEEDHGTHTGDRPRTEEPGHV
jgi:glycosyltransferase involved in cell wall biosynthesis